MQGSPHLMRRNVVNPYLVRLGQTWKQAEYFGHGPRVRAADAVAGERGEVLAHREIGEDLPAFGHQRDA